MSLLKFNIREFESVPDGFRYTHPETGHTDRHVHKEVWFQMIKDHLRRMNLPIRDDIEAVATDQCCRLLPPGFCVYEGGAFADHFINTRVGMDDIVNGTKVLSSFVLNGMPLVDPSVAEERARVCSACYANLPIEGCSSCRNLVGAVMEVAGARKTSADAQIENRACGVCKCATAAQVWIPIEILAKGWTAEHDSIAPEPCWKAKGIRALTESENVPTESNP